MTEKDIRSGQTADMRRQAEEIARQNEVQSPEDIDALSPAEIRQTLHELRVHQIEMEMQNVELNRIQGKLEASRARYFDLYDMAPVGYCTLSEKGLIMEANFTVATLLSITRQKLVKQPFSRFVMKDDQDIFYLHSKQILDAHSSGSGQAGEPQECELRMLKKDGAAFWAHLAMTAAQDENGAPVCRVALSDITEHKLQEDEREFTARLIALVNTPGDFRARMSDLTASLRVWSGCEAVGIRLRAGDDYPYYETRGFPPAFVEAENHLCVYGPEGEILRDHTGNPLLECMCGNILCGRFDPAKPFFTAHGSFWSNSTTALLASTTEADRHARTRNRCNGEGYESVALIPLRTGQQVFGLLQFNDHRPNRFTPSMIVHFERMADNLAIALSRRQTEETLRESELKYRSLIESSSDAIFCVDEKGHYKFTNHLFASTFGKTPDYFIGKTFWDVYPKEHADYRYEATRRLFQTGKSESLEVEVPLPNETLYFYATTNPIKDETGKVVLNLTHAANITKLKQTEKEKQLLEERLQRAEKMEALGLLAGGVAHDLNNVLGVVVGYAELVLIKADESSSIRPHLVNIMNGGLKAAAIVDDLLTLARRGVSGREVLNLNKIVADCHHSPEFANLSSHHPYVKIKTEIDPDLLNISCSSVHLGKSLFNLVSNASEAMPKGGGVTIKTSNQYLDKPIQGYDQIQEGDYVVLSVSDTGDGISADNLKRIFEPFYTKKVMGRSGTGLGLAVVWGTVKDHHGYINVESEEGKGSTFTLYFPVTREYITPDAVATAISEYMGSGESILVVDDIKEQRDLAAGMLRTLNYNVASVESGEEAIAYLKEHQADLIILDMIMDPGMDGLDTYKGILEIRPKQKAIIVSGFSESDRVKAARGLGAGAYVRKPYIIEKLGLAVRKELDRSIRPRMPLSGIKALGDDKR